MASRFNPIQFEVFSKFQVLIPQCYFGTKLGIYAAICNKSQMTNLSTRWVLTLLLSDEVEIQLNMSKGQPAILEADHERVRQTTSHRNPDSVKNSSIQISKMFINVTMQNCILLGLLRLQGLIYRTKSTTRDTENQAHNNDGSHCPTHCCSQTYHPQSTNFIRKIRCHFTSDVTTFLLWKALLKSKIIISTYETNVEMDYCML